MRTLCWFRRDLRLEDHAALACATHNGNAIACFVYDQNILKNLPKFDKRVTFIFESLKELDAMLHKRKSRLLTFLGDPVKIIPQVAVHFGVKKVFAGKDYEPYAKKRDAEVCEKLKNEGILFELVKDHVIFHENEILNLKQQPYKIFTAYKNAWLKALKPEHYCKRKSNLENLVSSKSLGQFGRFLALEKIGFEHQPSIITPGAISAKQQLEKFSKKISHYSKERNVVSLNATSFLSMHLRFGTLSIREAVRFAHSSREEGHKMWLSELIWRDFFQMILNFFPYVENNAFIEKYQHIKWPGEMKHFKLWCEGKTGYPLVDAAMRYFNKTGWMHNRLRMVVASFLVKDLLIDWRLGERYFAKYLLDYDLASNNGNWQWCASTGVDAQPYFRVFNPTLQAKRFDPKGEFIRANLPERQNETTKTIFLPHKPIVEHKLQSVRAVRLFTTIFYI